MKRSKEHLYEALFDYQEGLCAFCKEPLHEEQFLNQIDRIEAGGAYSIENCRLDHQECHLKRHGNWAIPRFPTLRSAFQQRMLWMRTRMKLTQMVNVSAIKSPYITYPTIMQFEFFIAQIKEQEKHFDKLITKELNRIAHPIVETMRAIKGTGDITIGLLLSVVDIKKAKYPSSLWQYFGIGVPSADRYNKGVKGGGSKTHRAILRQWAESQVRGRTFYRQHEYDERRLITAEQDKWKSDAHRHADGCRVMVKLFLSHFWQIYRELDGLPIDRPYILGKDGHNHYISPQERGWPAAILK